MAEDIRVMGWHPTFEGDVQKLCDEFVEESLSAYGLEVHPDRLAQMIELCKGISFFLLINGKVQGLIAGFVVDSLTDMRPALQEVIWYVRKEYRAHGKMLMQAFEGAAKDIGVGRVLMALMDNSMADRLDVFYRRQGYRKFEVQYIKEL